jgi:hypothetical protein
MLEARSCLELGDRKTRPCEEDVFMAGNSPGNFLGPLTRADELKSYNKSEKNGSFAEGLGLGLKGLICVTDKWRHYTCNTVGYNLTGFLHLAALSLPVDTL